MIKMHKNFISSLALQVYTFISQISDLHKVTYRESVNTINKTNYIYRVMAMTRLKQ